MPGVIILNGPPRSGKDTAADIICDLLEEQDQEMYDVKMARPAFTAIPHLFGIPLDRWYHMYDEEKNVPQPELHGMTPREALIWICEDVMKPKFGRDYFGQLAGDIVARVSKNYWVTISDGGFPEEMKAVVDKAESPVYLVHVHRTGRDFSLDSRGYVQPEDIGVPRDCYHQLCNYGSLEDFTLATQALFRRITDET